MKKNYNIPAEILDTPYDDWEQPNIRFDVKEDENITKHILFCKTHKENSFSKVTEPKKVLFDAFIEIQKLPKIKDKNDPRDIEIFNKFTDFIKIFISHLMLYSKNETNTINLDDRKTDITVKELHELFKVASKGKRKAMLDQYVKHNCN